MDIPPDLVAQSTRASAPMLMPGRHRYATRVPKPEEEPPSKGAKETFSAGDRVRHEKFGEGIVVSCEPSGADYQVVVAFQGEAGIKKLLLSFAPLERVVSEAEVALVYDDSHDSGEDNE
jgi:DNA helicase-2/ATP-dependent DNA helicase PcrA